MIAVGAFAVGGLGVFWARGALGQQASAQGASAEASAFLARPVEFGTAGAASAEAAISEFLDAEVGSSQRSFEVLSGPDRERYPSPEVWNARRRGVLGDVVSWRWVDKQQLQTELVLVPDLSTTRGWQPAEVLVAWTAVDQQGWRVSLGESLVTETVPAAGAAVESARLWLTTGGACGPDLSPRLPTVAPSEPLLMLALCDGSTTDGHRFDVLDTAEPVAGSLAAELSLRYGPNAQRWARQVALDSSDPISLVLAPIGDDWVVIDAISSK